MKAAAFVAGLSVALFGSTIFGLLLADYLSFHYGLVLTNLQLAVASVVLSLWFAWGISKGPQKKEVLTFGEKW